MKFIQVWNKLFSISFKNQLRLTCSKRKWRNLNKFKWPLISTKMNWTSYKKIKLYLIQNLLKMVTRLIKIWKPMKFKMNQLNHLFHLSRWTSQQAIKKAALVILRWLNQINKWVVSISRMSMINSTNLLIKAQVSETLKWAKVLKIKLKRKHNHLSEHLRCSKLVQIKMSQKNKQNLLLVNSKWLRNP